MFVINNQILGLKSGTILRNQTCIGELHKRIWHAIQEFFHGNRQTVEIKEFESIYSFIKGEDYSNLQSLRNLVELKTRLKLCGLTQRLTKNEHYQLFRQNIKTAKQNARNNLIEDSEIKKWINSCSLQRKLFVEYGFWSYKAEEVPEGAVLLLNPKKYALGKQLTHGYFSYFDSILKKLKGVLCCLYSGYPYTHAEYSLGKGRFFHIDKKDGKTSFCVGKAFIDDRKPKNRNGKTCSKVLCGYELVILKNSDSNFVTKVSTIFERIGNLPNDQKPKVDIPTILNVLYFYKRTAEQNYLNRTVDLSQRYMCSGIIGAVLAEAGVDVGEEFNKRPECVTPADLYKSSYFEPYKK